MRIKMGVLALISVGALSQAFAMDPPAAPASPTSTSTTAAATTPATSSTTAEQATAAKSATATTSRDRPVNVVAGDADAEARLKRLRAAGYRPEVRNNQLVFCRKEQTLGSRFDKKVCATAEALDEQMHIGRDLLENTQRQGLLGNPRGG